MTHLTHEDRKIIEKLLNKEKLGLRAIGKLLNRSHSVIHYEITVNKGDHLKYDADRAQLYHEQRQLNKGNKDKISRNAALKQYIIERLTQDQMSPEQIAGRLKRFHKQTIGYVCHETIYEFIYADEQIKDRYFIHLRRHRPKRGKWHARKKRQTIKERVSIHQRPEIVGEILPEKTRDNLPLVLPHIFEEKLEIDQIQSPNDSDDDGIDDYADIVESARDQIGVIKGYDVGYYSGGYPPENTGACTDVLWRALEGAGYDLKAMIDEDMQNNGNLYPKAHDPNINFRRTQNVEVFLQRHAQSLTTEVILGDVENLSQWQGGDIVTFAQVPGGLWHTAIVSDKRRRDGVPLLIHNHGRGVQENNLLLLWPSEITGHFRWKL